MKKILLWILWFIILLFTYTSATISYLHGKATWDNVTMNFDGDYSNVWVITSNFKNNVCGTKYDGFLLTWQVDRWHDGYVYFSEDDGDSTVSSCVAVILSGSQFYLTWISHTDSGTGYTMKFNTLKLIYDKNKKQYYFDGTAVDDAYGNVNHWKWVYVTWLNLIDWSKTIVDYSDLTWNKYANGIAAYVNIQLKDVAWNPVVVLDNLDAELIESPVNDYTFLTKNAETKASISVTDKWEVHIPVYILKAIQNGTMKLKIKTSMPDIDGKYEHTLSFTGIKMKNPFKDFHISSSWIPIVWEKVSIDFWTSFYSGWNIDLNSVTISWTTSIVDSNINYKVETWVNLSLTGNKVQIVPNNVNETVSVVKTKFNFTKLSYKFKDFAWKKVTYNINKNIYKNFYADKRPISYFTWKNFNLTGQAWKIDDTFAFQPYLKDKHGYLIPDINFDIVIKDKWIANSYSWWDCNEIDGWYQTNCSALQFVTNGNTFSGAIDWVLWATVHYHVTNSTYNDIKIVSYKPVLTWNLSFEIKNLENTSDKWKNLSNYTNYINNSFDKAWDLKNISFTPYMDISLIWLWEGQNYVDAAWALKLKLENKADFAVKTSGILSWQVIKPTTWASFVEWWKINWSSTTLSINENKNKDISVQFDVAFTYTDTVDFTYKDHIQYTLSNDKFGSLKLIPWWKLFPNLSAKYKLWWIYVNWIVSKVQKYTTSVKSFVSARKNAKWLNFATIYNLLNKKAYKLIQGYAPEKTTEITELNGWIKYFDCSSDNWTIDIDLWWSEYKWKNLLIFKNCKINIESNIIKHSDNDSLVIFSNTTTNTNLNTKDYIKWAGNIYIWENVSDINAWLITNASIFTYTGSINKEGSILMPNRAWKLNSKQLYIHGTVISKNNIWWWLVTDGKVVIWSSRQVDITDYSSYFDATTWNVNNKKDVLNIAQIFDLWFARGYKYGSDGGYATGWLSEYCRIWWAWHWKKICDYPVIIEFDPSIKNNPLFTN